MEGVRARGDARRRRQRRHRVLDRERRPDGRAHGRFDHRGAAADAHRSRVPAHARRGDPGAARDRRRDGWFQRAVRRRPRHGPAGADRDEPARLALERACVEGDGLSDRQDRRTACGGVPARRDPQRHHGRDPRGVRADARLRGRQDSPVRIREVPGGLARTLLDHEVGRRDDGDRPDVRRGDREGVAGDRKVFARSNVGRRRGRTRPRPARLPVGDPFACRRRRPGRRRERRRRRRPFLDRPVVRGPDRARRRGQRRRSPGGRCTRSARRSSRMPSAWASPMSASRR